MLEHISIDELNTSLSEFVLEVCANRDETHGHNHMLAVRNNSMAIYENSNYNIFTDPTTIKKLVIIVAWLHDVFDHKYDHDSKLLEKCRTYLRDDLVLDDDCVTYIINIIERISYSAQIRAISTGGKVDWEQVLGSEGMFIRSIVSDADKLEALGRDGLKRCIDYNTMLLGKDFDPNILKKKVTIHCINKLFVLDEYFDTVVGKKMAINLKQELIDAYIEFMQCSV